MSGWRKARGSLGNGNCVEVASCFRKSTYSVNNGQCVEVGADWRKASSSIGSGQCVEAASGERAVLVRDTTDRDGPELAFPAQAWSAFAAALRGAA